MKIIVNTDDGKSKGNKRPKGMFGSRLSHKKEKINRSDDVRVQEDVVQELGKEIEYNDITENISLNQNNNNDVQEDIVDFSVDDNVNDVRAVSNNDDFEITNDDNVVEESPDNIVDTNIKQKKNKKTKFRSRNKTPFKKESSLIVDTGLLIIAVMLFLTIGIKFGHILISIILP